ncbi:MAG: class I SAM-dependent methyltransferase [Phycisphaerae bacterium]|nr:class I SAM-dependent methyltransferase [Phycisphaerae bacterium]
MVGWWSDHWHGGSGPKADPTHEPVWRTIADAVSEPGLLLEAGCGTGQWVSFLDGRGHTAIGIDYAVSGLRVGKAAVPGMRVCHTDFRTLPFQDNTFDYIVSFGAIEHDIAGPEQALKEFYRVLKPQGWLMCSVPCLNTERRILLPGLVLRDWLRRRKTLRKLFGKTEPYEFYQYVYSPGEYRRLLATCGFSTVTLRTYGEERGRAIMCLARRLLRRSSPFYCAHMMMAICRKRLPGNR